MQTILAGMCQTIYSNIYYGNKNTEVWNTE